MEGAFEREGLRSVDEAPEETLEGGEDKLSIADVLGRRFGTVGLIEVILSEARRKDSIT